MARIDSQAAFESSAERIRAFESYGDTDIFNAIVAVRKPATRFVESQFLDEIERVCHRIRL